MFWVVGNTSETQFTDTNEWVFRLSESLHSLVLGSFDRRSSSDGLPTWRSAWAASPEGKPIRSHYPPAKVGLEGEKEAKSGQIRNQLWPSRTSMRRLTGRSIAG